MSFAGNRMFESPLLWSCCKRNQEAGESWTNPHDGATGNIATCGPCERDEPRLIPLRWQLTYACAAHRPGGSHAHSKHSSHAERCCRIGRVRVRGAGPGRQLEEERGNGP